MKKSMAILLILALALGLAACSVSSAESAVHKIGVIVYNTGDEEVIGFREYLKGYIEKNFEMVEFVYSGSIRDAQEEQAFIQTACDAGVEGFLSFLSHDLKAEVALCEKNQAYYLLASGTVSDEDFRAVEDNPWFLGMFGPSIPLEFQAGEDMARYFAEKQIGNHYFVLSGGGAMGNEMHYQRTKGIIQGLCETYGVKLLQDSDSYARSDKPVTLDAGAFSVTVCPGYVSREEYLAKAKETFAAGSFDVVMSVLPPAEFVTVLGNTPLGVVDAFHTRNLQLVSLGTLEYVTGKYSSMIGPAFALMLNAVTGYAPDFRQNGKAIRVTQGFWTSVGRDDYVEKYTFSASEAMNAYNFDDLAQVIRIFNPNATLTQLVALAEACSIQDVQARRGA